jgi:hypothetical protein
MGPGLSSFGRPGGVDVLEVFAPKGKGRVIIGEFLGTGDFQALLLRSGGELRLRRMRISYWGDLPESIQIDILVATRLSVGNEPASNWFGLDPTSSSRADISERAPDVTRHVRTKRTHDGREAPIQIEEDRRVQVLVAIRKT